jgi:hypothetical protein
VPDKMAIERMNTQDRDFAKKAGRDAVVGPGAPGRDRDRPIGIDDLVPTKIERGSEDPSVEEREADTKVGAVNVPEEVGERVELRFDRRKDVESVLGKARVLSKGGVEKVSQGICTRGRGRRNAMEKRARVGGLPNPDGSRRKRARAVRVGMEVGGPPKGQCRSDRFVRRGGQGARAGSRSGRLTNPNSGPRIAGPNSMGTSGLGEMAKGEVSAPQIKRSAVLGRIASKGSSPERAEEGNSQS